MYYEVPVLNKLPKQLKSIVTTFFHLTLVAGVIFVLAYFFGSPSEATTSDLEFHWYDTNHVLIPSGDPIFDIEDTKPGDTYSAEVTVKNHATSMRSVGVLGEKTSHLGGLYSILKIEIIVDSLSVYGSGGSKSLEDFFTESNTPTGINLANLSPDQLASVVFTILFPFSSSNEYQQNAVVFDITVGATPTFGEIPEECKDINFDGETFIGTADRDVIWATSRNDLIITYEGNDKIEGSGGDDCIVSGDGNDKVEGGTGRDIILAGDGNDNIRGGTDDDVIYAGPGNDTVEAGTGTDYVYGEGGDDKLKGSSDNDFLFGGDGNDKLFGGSGIDVLHGDANNDKLDGGSDNDFLFGDADIDTADGRTGQDTCDAETEKRCELDP